MADYQAVTELSPPFPDDARVGLASLLLDTGEPQEAAAQVLLGLGCAPAEARLHCTLGWPSWNSATARRPGRRSTTALDLDPGLTEALADRALAAHEPGRHDEAVADLTAALKARPGDPDLLANPCGSGDGEGQLAGLTFTGPGR
jgi:thioredoxin-like negative regulator of GroEL